MTNMRTTYSFSQGNGAASPNDRLKMAAAAAHWLRRIRCTNFVCRTNQLVANRTLI